jgi:hypothetical protein
VLMAIGLIAVLILGVIYHGQKRRPVAT